MGSNKEKKCLKFVQAALAADTDECILWPYSCGEGYGHFGLNGKIVKAHSYICTQCCGPRPSRKHVAAHSCHQKKCINPRHLSWKTNSENMLDKYDAGTMPKKWFGSGGKLTIADRRKIASLKGRVTQRELAVQYGVVESSIRYIQNGRCKSLMTDE